MSDIKRYRIKLDMSYGMGDCEEVECPNGKFIRVDDLIAFLEKELKMFDTIAKMGKASSDLKVCYGAVGSIATTEGYLRMLRDEESN